MKKETNKFKATEKSSMLMERYPNFTKDEIEILVNLEHPNTKLETFNLANYLAEIYREKKEINLEFIKLLIEKKVDIHAKTLKSFTAFMIAILLKNHKLTKVFIDNGADVNQTSIYRADIKKYEESTYKYGTNFKEEIKVSPLEFAITNYDIDNIKLLVENGVDCSVRLYNLSLFGIGVVDREKYLIDIAISKYEVELVKLLLDKGIKITKTCSLKTPVEKGDLEFIKLLVKNGIDINSDYETPFKSEALLYICASQKNIEDYEKYNNIAKYLIEMGADVNVGALKLNSYSPLIECFSVKKDVYSKNYFESNINFGLIKLLVENNADVNFTNTQGVSILLKACSLDGNNQSDIQRYEIIKYLIDNGADVNISDNNGYTPLMDIKEEELIEIYLPDFEDEKVVEVNLPNIDKTSKISLSLSEKIMILLLDNGADINARNNMGMTALMKYSFEGNIRLVKILIDRGADVNITSSLTAFDLTTNDEIKEMIGNSKNHTPQSLVKLLSNFTLDKPLKYSTHYWDFDLQKECRNFDGYMEALQQNFRSIEDELKTLSSTLHKKIEVFLFYKEPNSDYSWCSKTHINMGWSSLDGLKEWCDSGKKPSDFKLKKPIKIGSKYLKKFEDIINMFKQEIEIRSEFNNLSEIFDKQKMNINKNFLFTPENSKLDKQFYGDTQNIKEAITLIFAEINKREQYPNIEVLTSELEDRSIEIRVIQKESFSNKSPNELLKKVNDGGGDMGNIKNLLLNLCDWSIESSYEDKSFKINLLHSSNVKELEVLSEKVLGFTHILRFYR